jgi:release factor glutamine methyltransferase
LSSSLAARLAAAGCVASDDEARELLRDAPDDDTLDARVRRREAGEPLAWIVGRSEFAGLRVHVTRGVYVPRRQTEELARRAAELLPARGVAIDLCTGSGAVAAWIKHAVPDASVVGVDIDPVAVACAARNRVRAVVGDLAAPFHAAGAIDVVTAVAPYVPTADRALLPSDVQRYEPVQALDGGDDGLCVVRRIVEEAAGLLRAGGHLLLELGGDQDAALAPDVASRGFTDVATWHDDDGDLRGLVAAKPRHMER